jgi:hypothetical protein
MRVSGRANFVHVGVQLLKVVHRTAKIEVAALPAEDPEKHQVQEEPKHTMPLVPTRQGRWTCRATSRP